MRQKKKTTYVGTCATNVGRGACMQGVVFTGYYGNSIHGYVFNYVLSCTALPLCLTIQL